MMNTLHCNRGLLFHSYSQNKHTLLCLFKSFNSFDGIDIIASDFLTYKTQFPWARLSCCYLGL